MFFLLAILTACQGKQSPINNTASRHNNSLNSKPLLSRNNAKKIEASKEDIEEAIKNFNNFFERININYTFDDMIQTNKKDMNEEDFTELITDSFNEVKYKKTFMFLQTLQMLSNKKEISNLNKIISDHFILPIENKYYEKSLELKDDFANEDIKLIEEVLTNKDLKDIFSTEYIKEIKKIINDTSPISFDIEKRKLVKEILWLIFKKIPAISQDKEDMKKAYEIGLTAIINIVEEKSCNSGVRIIQNNLINNINNLTAISLGNSSLTKLLEDFLYGIRMNISEEIVIQVLDDYYNGDHQLKPEIILLFVKDKGLKFNFVKLGSHNIDQSAIGVYGLNSSDIENKFIEKYNSENLFDIIKRDFEDNKLKNFYKKIKEGLYTEDIEQKYHYYLINTDENIEIFYALITEGLIKIKD